MLQVRLLGQFDVRADGKRINLPSRSGQSLLAYLLLTAGTAHRRERLAGLLWPDTSDDQARHNLRTELWRVRKTLGSPPPAKAEYFLTEELTIAFNPAADYWLDANPIRRPTAPDDALSDLAQQLALYEGELLPGFYDDWVVFEREHVQAAFERKMKQLIEGLCREQQWNGVLEWSERWLALGQTPEPAYRALMIAYGTLGDHAKVTAIFERCATALDKDLGVEPSPETRALYERVLRGEINLNLDLSASPSVPAYAPARNEPPAPGEPPFKGLQPFDEADADRFFGREALTARLVQRLNASRFLAVVVGASGSGKSSIVRAGLIPALRRGQALPDGTLPPDGSSQWSIHVITPTAHPLEALAVALTREVESVTATATLLDDLARDPRSLYLYVRKRRPPQGSPFEVEPRVVIVVDQFEELFTLCHDEFEREAFIDNLLTALMPDGGGTEGESLITVIITLRADFYAHLAQYPDLREAVAQRQEYIGPMTADELRRAIEEPAKRAGWTFETGLVDLILRDIGAEPGALPLLSHALLETWQRRSGHTLTLKGYADSGGIRGAIAYTAETVYQHLAPEQQALVRDIFLRLTEFGQGTEDTRRRARLDELIARPEQADQVRTVLTQLADARLVTTSADTVEVAHEALIREWPRLREWLMEDRDGLRLHRHLTEAVQEWDLLERDPGGLYRGARLAQASEWAAANPIALNAPERIFLAASQEFEQREAAERDAQRQRELAAALKLAATEKHSANRLRLRNRVIAIAGVMALMLAVVAGVFGVQSNQNATLAQASAATAQAETHIRATAEAIAVQQRAEALRQASIGLAAQAVTELDSTAPERSVPLALEALENYPYTAQAESALANAVAKSLTYIDLDSQLADAGFDSGTWSRDGQRFAAATGSKIVVWDISTGASISLSLNLPADWIDCTIEDLAWSPTGEDLLATMIAAVESCPQIQPPTVWHLASGKIVRTFDTYVRDAAHADWSANGNWIAIGDISGTVKIWDSQAGTLHASLTGHSGLINNVVFSPQSDRLATASADATAKVWDIASGQVITTLSPHSGRVTGVSWSPDGLRVATSSADGLGRVWDATSGQLLLTLAGHTAELRDIAWSPSGERLATVSGDGTLRVWDALTGLESNRVHTQLTLDVAWSPQGDQLTSGTASGYANYARLWRAPRIIKQLIGHQLAVIDAQWSPDGNRIASGGNDTTVRVWDAATKQELQKMEHPDLGGYFDWSPDGQRIVTVGYNGKARIWDITAGKLITDPVLRPEGNWMWASGWSSDGSRIASASYPDFVTVIWDPQITQVLATVGDSKCFMHYPNWSPTEEKFVTGCVFSAGTRDNTPATIWDAHGNKVLDLPSTHGESVRGEWSPDGTRIAVGYEDGTAKIWNAVTGQELLTVAASNGNWIWHVTWAPDGKRVASADANGVIKVWDVATGGEVMSYQVPGTTFSLDWSPDGQYLIAAGVYPIPVITRIWQSTDELIQYAKECCVIRELTAAERQQFGLTPK